MSTKHTPHAYEQLRSGEIEKGQPLSETTKKPVARVSLFPVTAAIWRNASQKGEAFYSVTFERSYRDEGGHWRSAASFNTGELLLLAKVADLAHTEVLNLRAQDKNVPASEASAM